MTGADYAERIQRLEDAFGKTTNYMEYMVNRLIELRAEDKSLDSLRKVCYAISGYLRTCKKKHRNDPILLALLHRHVHEEWLHDYNRSIQKKRKKDTPHNLYLHLSSLMDATARTLEQKKRADVISNQSNQRSRNYTTMAAAATGESDSSAASAPAEDLAYITQGRMACYYCKKEHSLYYCERFFALDAQSRRDIVAKYKGCFNCLHPGHSINDCRDKTRCRYCKKNHHDWLHLLPTTEATSNVATTDALKADGLSEESRNIQHEPSADRPLSATPTPIPPFRP